MVIADEKYFFQVSTQSINMALIFNLEKEDLHDIVFAYSLKFSSLLLFIS